MGQDCPLDVAASHNSANSASRNSALTRVGAIAVNANATSPEIDSAADADVAGAAPNGKKGKKKNFRKKNERDSTKFCTFCNIKGHDLAVYRSKAKQDRYQQASTVTPAPVQTAMLHFDRPAPPPPSGKLRRVVEECTPTTLPAD